MKLPPTPYITALWPDYISASGDENPYLDGHQGYSLEVPSLGFSVKTLVSVQFYHDQQRHKHCQQKTDCKSVCLGCSELDSGGAYCTSWTRKAAVQFKRLTTSVPI